VGNLQENVITISLENLLLAAAPAAVVSGVCLEFHPRMRCATAGTFVAIMPWIGHMNAKCPTHLLRALIQWLAVKSGSQLNIATYYPINTNSYTCR
jgi:hypothetical protein